VRSEGLGKLIKIIRLIGSRTRDQQYELCHDNYLLNQKQFAIRDYFPSYSMLNTEHHNLNLKGSGDGVQHSKLLGFCDLSIVRNSKNSFTSRKVVGSRPDEVIEFY
jgi:hypothetical protein